MLAKINSFGLNGISGYAVTVEIDISNGLPNTEVVGLPDAAVKESRERVRSAIANSGYRYSPKKIIINSANPPNTGARTAAHANAEISQRLPKIKAAVKMTEPYK